MALGKVRTTRPLFVTARPVGALRPVGIILAPRRDAHVLRRPLFGQMHKLQRLGKSRCTPIVQALWGSRSNDGDFPHNPQSSRRQAMLSFVNGLTPSSEGSGFDMPAPVISAVRQTVTNLLGTLPPQFFSVTIKTRSDNLAQLMFSVLMTGYMFCNGWYRLQLAQSMGGLASGPALVGSGSSFSGSIDDELVGTQLAAGTQKLRIEGEVLRWHHEDGVQQVPALEYIEQLEAELASLQLQLAAQRAAAAAASAPTPPRSAIHDTHNNELLEYLKGLSGEQVAELTDCATPDVLEAMNALVRRLIGEDGDNGEWSRGKTECTASELAQLLCWLMAVGHQLRALEVKLSLLQSLETEAGIGTGADDGDTGPAVPKWVPRLPPGR